MPSISSASISFRRSDAGTPACGFNLRSSGPSSRKEKPRFGSSICIEETPRSAKRKKQPIETTSQLREIVEQVVLRTKPENPKETVKKTCQRVFQALRIDVNSEFEVLDSFLEALPHILKPGGKAAILTFHSGEDRMVKKSFQYYAREGIYSDIAKDVIRPSAKECASNPRARSTKFRWAVRSDVQKYE